MNQHLMSLLLGNLAIREKELWWELLMMESMAVILNYKTTM